MTPLLNDRFFSERWHPATGEHETLVVNPFSERAIRRVRECSSADIDLAVAAARRAVRTWSDTEPARRAKLLRTVAQGLRNRAEELAQAITAEMGMPIKLCRRIQVGLPIDTFERTADLLECYPWEEQIGHSRVRREPAGVVAAITPWNYPLHQIAAKVAPALGAGCTVVLKPSELTPTCAFLLAEIFETAGAPPGVFNLVTGAGHRAGDTLASHAGVDLVSFTGSTATGRRILHHAVEPIRRVRLELGGKSAAVVLPGSDLAKAVKATVNSAMLNAGQTCSALTRLLVHRANYDEAAALARAACAGFVAGDPGDEACRLGPVVSALQRERVLGHVRRAISEGARLLFGDPDGQALPPSGYFVTPTLLGDVSPDAAAAQEEIFGPVLCLMRYESDAEALEIANHSRYGLSGAVWARDDQEALSFARGMRTGQVDINGAAFNPLAPFGGYKQSGQGREMGWFGLDEFVELKSIQCP